MTKVAASEHSQSTVAAISSVFPMRPTAERGQLLRADGDVLFYEYGVLPWDDLTRPMEGIWRIAKTAGWVVPHERVCRRMCIVDQQRTAIGARFAGLDRRRDH